MNHFLSWALAGAWPPQQHLAQLKTEFPAEVSWGAFKKANQLNFLRQPRVQSTPGDQKHEQKGSAALSSPQCHLLPWWGVRLGEDAGGAQGLTDCFLIDQLDFKNLQASCSSPCVSVFLPYPHTTKAWRLQRSFSLVFISFWKLSDSFILITCHPFCSKCRFLSPIVFVCIKVM